MSEDEREREQKQKIENRKLILGIFTACISLAGLIISSFATYYANQAQSKVDQIDMELKQRQADFKLTYDVLGKVYEEIITLERQHDAESDTETKRSPSEIWKERVTCNFVNLLRDAEIESRKDGPHYVQKFIDDTSEQKLWSPNCRQDFERYDTTEVEGPTDFNPPDDSTAEVEPPEKIGRWHALISSYDITTQGCKYATRDVEDFAEDLTAPKGQELFIYVVQTKISRNYAVTVDAGDDLSLAKQLVPNIKRVAREKEAGTDAFVQVNKNWEIPDDCFIVKKLAQAK